MKVTVCQIDPRGGQIDSFLERLKAHIAEQKTDFLLLPEMGFSDWLAGDKPGADADAKWARAVADHERGIDGLGTLGAKAIVGTRPILTPENSRRNEAYVWTRNAPRAAGFHQKYYLPDEGDYYEASWYDRGPKQFDTARALGARIGVQICTELWFFEWARHYARSRADILCVPRATPHGNVDKWIAGGQAAAVCSGAYCLSSNLWAPEDSGANLGGGGWIIDPEGKLLARTDETNPFASAEIDLAFAKASKAGYPRYVAE
jgi:N-carbamoylputrescine amidase